MAVAITVLTPLGERVGATLFAGDAYTIHTEVNFDTFEAPGFGTVGMYLFEVDDPTNISPPPNGTMVNPRLFQWSRDNGGTDFGQSYFRFTVSARTAPVQIVGAYVDYVREEPKRTGIVAYCKCGGPLAHRHIRIDLDEKSVLYYPQERGALDSPPEPFSFTLAPGETESFLVKATSEFCNCEWQLKLDMLVDGTPEQATINSAGAPFLTLGKGSNNAEKYFYFHEGRWSE